MKKVLIMNYFTKKIRRIYKGVALMSTGLVLILSLDPMAVNAAIAHPSAGVASLLETSFSV